MRKRWKKIDGYPGYSISNTGEVRNDVSGKMKTIGKNSNGYSIVNLYKDGKRRTTSVHLLVGKAYIPNAENKPQINHKDGNKLNNHYQNLEWATSSENMLHAYSTGLAKPSRSMLGKKNPNAGRHGKPIRILETGEEFPSILDCEKAIDGNNRHICDCLSGRQKTHRGYHFEYI